MASTDITQTAKLWDVEPGDGNQFPFEPFVVEATNKADADSRAADRLAAMDLPAAKFKLTSASAASTAPLAPTPKRDVTPDPKPGAAKATRKPASGKPAAKKSAAKKPAKAKAVAKPARKPAAAKDGAPRVGAKQLAVDILTAEGGPLHTKVIVERIIASGKASGLRGKTPGATIAAMLAVDAKKQQTFKRTGPGTFDLISR